MRSSLLVLAVALALVAVPTAAGAGTLSVSSPVTLGSTFTVSGCGYDTTAIAFEVAGPRKSGIDYFTAAQPVGANGCYSDTWTAWWGVAGDYQITSYALDSKGGRKKAAVVKFTVTA